MGAIERNGFRFVPEFSVSHQNGAIHVYNNKERFIEEIKFEFSGDFPELNQIEDLVNDYCKQKEI
ncbi:YbxH family protein [Neobacillus vireti]|uniref:YbxH family protein n=1 Tax=Neobacillus vireti TaxID=220686 RepID=UPI003000B4EC